MNKIKNFYVILSVFSAAFIVVFIAIQSFAQGSQQTDIQTNFQTKINLENLKTIQDLKKEYQTAFMEAQVQVAKTPEYRPMHIRALQALRFINRPDWEKFTLSGGTNPQEVYSPKPTTWDNWYKTQIQVMEKAHNKNDLSKQELLNWNANALRDTLESFIKIGEFKNTQNYGRNISLEEALTQEEVSALNEIHFLNESKPVLKWTPLLCKEEITETFDLVKTVHEVEEMKECKSIYEKAVREADSGGDGSAFWNQTLKDYAEVKTPDELEKKWFWFACWPRLNIKLNPKISLKQEIKKERSCGMIEYPSPDKVKSVLTKLMDQTNEFIKKTERMQTFEDPVLFAIRAQRQLVALHPFNKGNGRVSRWLMDYITERLNLPPILVKDMNRDLSTHEAQYYKEAIEGMKESIQLIRFCTNEFKTKSVTELKNSICASAEVLPNGVLANVSTEKDNNR